MGKKERSQNIMDKWAKKGKVQPQILQKQVLCSKEFMNVTKRLLLNLSNKRKSKNIEKKQRIQWSKTQAQNQNLNIQNKKIRIQQKSINLIEEEQQNTSKQKQITTLNANQIKVEFKQGNHLKKQQNIKIKQIQQLAQTVFKTGNKIKLYGLSLKTLVAVFFKQFDSSFQCKCIQNCCCKYSNTVKSIINKNEKIKKNIKKLRTYFCQMCTDIIFNEDRMVMIDQRISQDCSQCIFHQYPITIYEHRALGMLLKKMKPQKYSLSIPNQKMYKCAKMQSRNIIVQKFYKYIYDLASSQYYKLLLQIQLKYKRYSSGSGLKQQRNMNSKHPQMHISNTIRCLLQLVFKQKIKGQQSTRQEIKKLQNQIYTSSQADHILSLMMKNNKNVQVAANVQTVTKKEQSLIQTNQNYKVNKMIGNFISADQKKALDKSIKEYKESRVDIPYPYCLFLQYRLRAQKKTYATTTDLSDDQNQKEEAHISNKKIEQIKRIKQMNVYKGYKGYKTTSKIIEVRRRNKGIFKVAKLYSNSEQFQLQSLQKPTQIGKQVQEPIQILQDQKQKQNQSQIKLIPFPYYLSIFNKDAEHNNGTGKKQKQKRNTHKNKKGQIQNNSTHRKSTSIQSQVIILDEN